VSLTEIEDRDVAAAFDGYAPDLRCRLLWLRELIVDVAEKTPGVGAIEETLKWRQPSYRAVEPASGTAIRLGAASADPGAVSLYVHCGTTLIDRYSEIYPDEFDYVGNREVVIGDASEAALRHLIAMALTYRRRSKA